MLRTLSLALFALVPIFYATGCENDDPIDAVTCGAGTILVDAECRPEGTPIVCAKGTVLANGTCIPSAEACGAGTMLDATGVCVSLGDIACGTGTMLVGNQCVPDPTAICGAGTTYDAASGTCLANLACRPGEVAVNGLCLSPEEIDASMADVTESTPDDNDPSFGGAPESLPTPAIGDSTIFVGTIQDPIDRNGDFEVDQDWDHFSFTARAGETFEIVLRSLDSTELGFVVMGPNGYRRLSPLYFQPEPSRHVILPYDGTYAIAIAPQLAIEGVTDAGPIGGDEYRYVAVLEQEAFPAASDLPLGGSASGELYDLQDNLHAIRAPANSLVRIELGPVGGDARPVLLTFDGAGNFRAELDALPIGGLVHRTAAADDLMLLMDWSRLVGEEDAYTIETIEIVPNDAGTLLPDSTLTSSTATIAGGDTGYFVATVAAGQIVEVAILGGVAAPDLRVLAPDGALLDSAADSRATRFYAPIGGGYTVEIASNDTTNEGFAVVLTSITPVAIGPLDTTVATATTAFWLPDVAPNDNAYFVVTAAEPAQLDLAASQQSTANLSLAVYDATFAVLRQVPFGGVAPALSAFLPDPGAVIVEVVGSSPGVDVVGLALDVSVMELPPLEVEPNDTIPLATALVLDAPIFGEAEAGDTDFYRITLLAPLAADQILEVRAVESTETDAWSCQLSDSIGMVLEEQTPRHQGCVIFASGLGSGDYYFAIQKAEPVLRLYRLVAAVIPGVRESEPNDQPPGNALGDVVPTYGEAALNTDADVFTFQLAADLAPTDLLTVSAELVGTRSTGTMQVGLQGPNVNSTFPLAPAASVIRAGLTAGEYRIRMTRTSANAAFDGHYRIAISTSSVSITDVEPNDNAAQAQSLGALPGSAIGQLAQPTTNDDDWFTFALPQDLAAGQTLAIELHRIGAQPTDSLRVTLFDGAQALIAASSAGDPRRVAETGLVAGTFYVRVDSTFNTTIDADYLLLVSVE